MRNPLSKSLAALLLLLPIGAQTKADPNRHVIVISLDGFPAYALRDQTLPLPVMRRMIREGGVAEGMKTVNPTVTWPNHTAMVTGVDASQNGVLYNAMPVREGDGKPIRLDSRVSKSELVLSPTVYDAAHEAGLTTAEVAWVAIREAKSIDWSFSEGAGAGGALARELVEQGAITAEEMQAYRRAPAPFHDELRVRAAVHLIEKHRPNLLLLHLAATDDVQHTYGARTLAAQTALVLADRQIQRILDAIDRAGIRENTTVLVVSDHGFKKYQNMITPEVWLRRKGLIRGTGDQADCDASIVIEGGSAYIYVTRESKREATLKSLKDIFTNAPGIAKVIWPEDFSKYGYPQAARGGRMSDLVIEAAPGYAFQGNRPASEPIMPIPPGGENGTHGYLNTDPDMDAIFVAWGAGIRPGSRTGVVPNTRVAGTIASLLSLNLAGSAPIYEILSK